MGNTSKDLLRLECKTSSTSPLESALLVCNNKDSHSDLCKHDTDRKPAITSVPKSQFLGKVKDFLGVISEANKRLELGAKDNSRAYDIEVLSGNESQVIEMDLMLGVADLQTPEAVAAAESAIAGNQPLIPLAASSIGTESDVISDEEIDDDDNDDDDSDENVDNRSLPSIKSERSKKDKDDSSNEAARKNKSRKRPRIIELS